MSFKVSLAFFPLIIIAGFALFPDNPKPFNNLEKSFHYHHRAFDKTDSVINDVIPINLNNDDHIDFIFIPLPAKQGFKQKLIPALGQKQGGLIFLPESYIESNSFEHIRNWSLIDDKNTNSKYLFLADHGIDQEPFSGGFSKYYKISREGLKLERTLSKRMFTFDICSGDFNGDGYIDAYLSNLDAGDRTPPQIFGLKELRPLPLPNILPKDLTEFKIPSIACSTINFNNDKYMDLLIGSGSNENYKKSDDFLILMDKTGASHLLPFPRGKNRSDWVTSNISVNDLNKDGFQDIVTLSHNKKLTEGSFSIFFNSEGKSLKSIPIEMDPQRTSQYWFMRPLFADLNGDQLTDIIILPRPTNLKVSPEKSISLIALINNQNRSFKEITFKSKLFKNKGLSGVVLTDFDKDNDMDILAFHYGINEYTILERINNESN